MSHRLKPQSQSRVLWIALSLILTTAVIALLLSPRQPRYQGKALSQYLMAFSNDGYQISSQPPYGPIGVFSPSAERTEAWEALGHFGDEVIPVFVKLASARDSTLSRSLRWLATKVPRLNLQFPTAGEKRSQAVSAFIRLGSRGAPAVPQLLPLLEDQSTARAAIFSLAFIEPEGDAHVLALTDVLWRFDQSVLKIDAMAALATVGRRASRAAPVLTDCLKSTNDQVSAMAAVALSRIGEKTPEAAALIAGRLSSASRARGYVAPPLEMYLWALGEFGPLANNALPIIAGFTNNASGRVREIAEAAIRRIEGAVEPNAPP